MDQAPALLTLEQPFDLGEAFGREAPLGVEIGFGMGHALAAWAAAAPDWNLLGIEVYEPGIGALLLALKQASLDNVRVAEADAAAFLAEAMAPASIDELRVFFPDPWPKKRHHKRRLIQDEFVALAASRLKAGGRLLLATDWQPYAEWMLEVLERSTLENLAPSGSGFAPRAPERIVTRFEARGERLGHDVWDLSFRRPLKG
jgi:tRNA (guanine-N7-)-methyltransferase